MKITKQQFIKNIKRIAVHRKEAQSIRNKHMFGKHVKIEDIEINVPKLPKKFNGTT
jgi:hypothetical protein